jgi:hypothetical protein
LTSFSAGRTSSSSSGFMIFATHSSIARAGGVIQLLE